MEDKYVVGGAAASGAGTMSPEEYAEMEKFFQESEKQRTSVDWLIDSTIISALEKSPIFQNIMPIEELRTKLLDIVKHVIFEDMHEKGCVGYWRSADGTLAIEERLKDNLDSTETRETIIHELLHALSTKEVWVNEYKVERWCGIQKNVGYTETGRGLNEGITEYLAQKLCPEFDYVYSSGLASFYISGTYCMEQIAIKQLAILYGEDKIIDAYLNNHDIDMPQEQYLELRSNFDYINEKDSRKRDIYKGRTFEELSESEQEEVLKIENNVETTFIRSQQYFLEKCLTEEINKISTLEQAEEMKAKLRELNSLGINISGHEKANYAEYNFAFIRKYLQIINQDKSYEEQVKFDDVENYLMGNEVGIVSREEKTNIFGRTIQNVKKRISSIRDTIFSKKEKYIAIDRGNEGKIYIKQVGKDTIAGYEISEYEYLTEEQYEQYKVGDSTIKGEILRGNIDIDRLKKDKDYEFHVGHRLLSQDRIEDKLLNYNGYVGGMGEDNRKCVNSEVKKRFEEHEKYIKIEPEGYEQDMYIIEVLNKDNDDVSRYLILTRDEVEARKRQGISFEPTISVQGNIDLGKLSTDKGYRDVVERTLLTKDRIEECGKNFQGYVGEIETNMFGHNKCNFTKHIEQFSSRGANGEEKCNWGYFSIVNKTGEIDRWGNEVYEYEVIPAEEMQKMWNDPEYIDDPERERIIAIGSKNDLERSFVAFDDLALFGGYIGYDDKLSEKYENKKLILEEFGVVLWKMGDNTYLSPLGKGEFNNRNRIHGNLDVERMNTDPEYKRFVMEKILTQGYVFDILAQDINNIEINEKDGELSIGKISKKKKPAKPQFDRKVQGQDR